LLPVAPFRFDPALADQPSRFEYHFICEEQRYSFELALTAHRIVEEKLRSFPMGKEILLYHRQYTPDGDQYQFGSHLEGGELLHKVWCDLTNSQTLFIKQAVKNSNDNLKQLRIPFNWFINNHCIDPQQMPNYTKTTIHAASLQLGIAKRLASFLQTIDVPMAEIQFETASAAPVDIEQFKTDIRGLFDGSTKQAKATFMHATELGSAGFELAEESKGTQNLIGFWSLWDAFNQQKETIVSVLVFDELDASLHPNIVASLIRQRQEQEHTRQLIFTTHDTHLMDTKLLRRDQIWLTERDANGATQLYSIHDIAGRESEDIEKRYYEGRYRGLPILRKR
jgi:predicted ATPase